MNTKALNLYQDESGLSALETAIVLIAFVVVAAVFAFTMLSAGMFSTERSKEAVYAGLEEVRGSMELKGSVVLTTTNALTGTTGSVQSVIFTIANVAGGAPVDLTPKDAADADNVVVIDYRDQTQRKTDLRWSAEFLGKSDGDTLLEEGELAQITITGLKSGDPTDNNLSGDGLSTNTDFAIEIKPPQGGVLELERRTPARIDKVMDLQ